MRPKSPLLHSPFLIVYLISLLTTPALPLSTDGLALLALKSAIDADPTKALSNWNKKDSDPCHWLGVACSTTRRVVSLSLSGKSLAGYIPSELGLLGTITQLTLSNNFFTGSIPSQIASLQNLAQLDLSSNKLNGSLPVTLPRLPRLVGTLNLSHNAFTGNIPSSYGRFPITLCLDLSHNNLSGSVPLDGSLVNQGPTAFSGNPALCGFPLANQCPVAVKIPSINPLNASSISSPSRKSRLNVVVLVVAVIALLIFAVPFCVFLVKRYATPPKPDSEKAATSITKSEPHEGQEGKFVVLDNTFTFELEDLLRASAFVVGKSKGGIVYKVIASAGSGKSSPPTTLAVRRLNDGDSTWKLEEFERVVESMARIQHHHIVRLKGYYYAQDEKLLITDYLPNGTLRAALHGGALQLPWAARLRIAQGTAKGLAYIHEYGARKNVHGNLKSSKILLDENLQPAIAGFGLSRLIPESSPMRNATTQKDDVYAFGVLLMEIISGMDPHENRIEDTVRHVFEQEGAMCDIIDPALMSEARAKGQVTAVYHVALACTDADPELRPKMRSVADTLDSIKEDERLSV